MASIFSKIVAGEIPCHKVAESKNCLAFLDINPLMEGHTLCIPKKEINYIFDIDDETLSELTLFSKKVAAAIKKTIPCNRIGVAVIGLEVPHAHIHLMPIDQMSDMSFEKPKLTLSQDQLAKMASSIQQNM